MNCREFRNQFEVGLNLSKDAKNHLATCVDCEVFCSEESQLSQVFKALPRVEAPNNFEFEFKSKLAQAKLNEPISPVWQTLRYALPLVAVVLIFGFVIINSNLFSNKQTPQVSEQKRIDQKQDLPDKAVDQKEEPKNELVAQTESENNESGAIKQTEKADNSKTEMTPPVVAKPKLIKKKVSDKDEIITLDSQSDKDSSKILDTDTTLNITRPINPPGIDPSKNIPNPQMPQNPKSFTAREILLQLGIETSNQDGRLKVNSVIKNSAAEKSGVKVGDIVTAIDGQKLSEKPLRKRSVQGKFLRVRRSEQELDITIKN